MGCLDRVLPSRTLFVVQSHEPGNVTEVRVGWRVMKRIPKVRMLLVLSTFSLAGCARMRLEREAWLQTLHRWKLAVGREEEEGSGEIIWRVDTDKKVVALTFDDGPDPKYTPTVLKLAREKGLRLTFFLVGREIRLHAQLARQEVAEGHAIGNHSWDHQTMTYETKRQDISEIERCEDEIERICGERTHLFRPPKGLWDGDVFATAREFGYRMILWTLALEHHSAKTPEAMARRAIDRVRPGMIILAHDGEPCHRVDRSKTLMALPKLVDGLQRKGYRFVTIPELLELSREQRRAKGPAVQYWARSLSLVFATGECGQHRPARGVAVCPKPPPAASQT